MELDSLAAGLAATKASEAHVDAIAQLARQKPAREPVAQLERNRAFHRAIYGACGNGALITYLDQLWDRTDRYRLILVKQELIGGPASRAGPYRYCRRGRRPRRRARRASDA